MIKLSIKNRFTGSIIFEYEKENNTIVETIKEFIRKEIGAGKSHADLRYANLRYADLRYADLRHANLRYADLRYADLRHANLGSADLGSADLRHADLSYANLHYGKIKFIRVINGLYKYIVIPYVTETGEARIKMGCYDRTLKEWEDDFWNNPDEFPNDGSEKSNLRLLAFETAKQYLKIITKTETK